MISKRFKKSPYLIALAVFLLLIFLHYTKILMPLEKIVLKTISPLQEKTFFLSSKINYLHNIYKNRQENSILIEENKKLTEKIKKLTIENSNLKRLEEENKILKEELNFLNNNQLNDRTVTTNIIGYSTNNDINSLIINGGSDNGISEGMPVITQDGLLIGKIIKANKTNSVVLLLIDNNSKVAASIQNQTQTSGLIEGQLGLGIQMNLIPQNEEIEEGDIVITSGLEEKIPKGLIIGQIEKLLPAESGYLFKSAVLKSLVDYNNLSIVSVIKGAVAK